MKIEEELNIKANYIHSNGDKAPIKILGYDGKGQAWVKWQKDGFINMVPVTRLELLDGIDDET